MFTVCLWLAVNLLVDSRTLELNPLKLILKSFQRKKSLTRKTLVHVDAIFVDSGTYADEKCSVEYAQWIWVRQNHSVHPLPPPTYSVAVKCVGLHFSALYACNSKTVRKQRHHLLVQHLRGCWNFWIYFEVNNELNGFDAQVLQLWTILSVASLSFYCSVKKST